MQPGAKPLLTDLLKAVSRSFYLTLRVLPARVRPQIGLAYLLARATDTIADTELVPVAERLQALEKVRGRILGESGAHTPVEFFNAIVAAQPDQPGAGTNFERILLQRIEDVIALLDSCSEEDRKRIRDVLSVIVSGQQLDLVRFGMASIREVIALRTDAELDDYTFRVAGCVGEFWTHVCRAHVFPQAPLNDAALLRNGVKFGKGLQLVNILRDLPKDLAQGRCYVPAERLARVQLKPRDLLQPSNEKRLRPVYDELLDLADSHLAAGWAYTNSLPASAMRVRLACAWPILIGARTLTRLRRENPLDPSHRVKVPRNEVKRIMMTTLLRYPFRSRWQRLFAEAKS